MGESTTMTIRIDRTISDRLDALAGRRGCSKAALATEAIEDYLAAQDRQIGGVRQALRSLDDGRGIPHGKVVAWVTSWGTGNELPKPNG
jgi:predicted transcriptional regulator